MSDPTYYVSAYLAPPGREAILHPLRHDHAVALWSVTDTTVELVSYWELERTSGQKHHDWPLYTPERARAVLATLLAEEGLGLDDVTEVWGTPGLGDTAELTEEAERHGLPVHALCHLFSAMLLDTDVFADEVIVGMAMDGGPDLALERGTPRHYYAGGVSKQGRVVFEPVESGGPLYLAAERLYGWEPGTLMALAGASEATIDADPAEIVAAETFFGGPQAHADARRVVGRLDELARATELRAVARGDGELTALEHRASAVMKVVQRATEIVARRNVARLLDTHGVDPSRASLALAGGFALNCPTNSYLMEEFGFRRLLAPPCPNDSGQALGIGLMTMAGRGLLPKRRFALPTAYAGSRPSDAADALAEFAGSVAGVEDFDADRFAADVEAGLVGWVQGRAELGPRALGHRSLLGDPRRRATKDRLNAVKSRQWWRPVAPIVLLEHVAEWFDGGRPSPYMLETFPVAAAHRAEVPAIAHLDGSARIQTLDRPDNELLHAGMTAFAARTGVPLLGNTSLNDRGEPIAATARQALNFCVRKQVPVLYLDGRRIALRPGDAPPAGPADRSAELFTGQQDARDAIWARWRADGYTDEMIYALVRSPELAVLARADPAGAARRIRVAAATGAARPGFDDLVAGYVAAFGPGSGFDGGRAGGRVGQTG